MSETPEKMWLRENYTMGPEKIFSDDIPYIRADLVDELVEALEAVVRYAGNTGDDYLADNVRAALAKARGEKGNE